MPVSHWIHFTHWKKKKKKPTSKFKESLKRPNLSPHECLVFFNHSEKPWMEYRNSTRDNSHLVPSTIQSDGSLCIVWGGLYCTCRRGRPCTSSPSLPRPRDTFCRCGGCSRRRLRPSSRTFPGASGSGRKSARRTAGWNSWLLAVEAPGARSSSSWGDDKAFLNYFSPPPHKENTQTRDVQFGGGRRSRSLVGKSCWENFKCGKSG